MGQYGLGFGEAAKIYTLLTIGDGLVSTIPALLLSTASAIIVTRVSDANDLGQQVMTTMFATPQALGIAAAIMIAMGLVPGMPHMAFLSLGALCGAGAYWIAKKGAAKGEVAAAGEGGEMVDPSAANRDQDIKELSWEDVNPVDMVGLEVGYRLIPLVDKSQGGQLLARIKGVRKKMSQELGFLVPTVHIRDNLDLLPNVYRITLTGVTLDEAEIHPDRELAINPGQVFGTISGIPAKDPAFGLDAVWIERSQRDQAQTMGYTVVDASTVVATHLNQLMIKHAHELLGYDEVQKMLDQLQKSNPKLVESIVPNPLPLSKLHKVLQNLLQENVPIRDLRSIAEALAEVAPRTTDPELLTAAARVALARMIVQSIVGNEESIPVITLQPELEQLLLQSVQQAQQSGGSLADAVIEPGLAQKLQRTVSQAAQKQEMSGQAAILLVAAGVRPMLSRFLRYSVQNLNVLSYNEIPDNKQITIVATVGH
jgi:flagellar biosynthesis protein FlhA